MTSNLHSFAFIPTQQSYSSPRAASKAWECRLEREFLAYLKHLHSIWEGEGGYFQESLFFRGVSLSTQTDSNLIVEIGHLPGDASGRIQLKKIFSGLDCWPMEILKW